MKYQKLNVLEKLKIIEEAKFNGVILTCQKYGINHVSYYNWLKKLETSEGTALIHQKRKNNNGVFDLASENMRLRNDIQEKELLIQRYQAIIDSYLPNKHSNNKPRLSLS